MYSQISIVERTASIWVYSGHGYGPHVTLLGATYPIVPFGTVVDKFSVAVPSGLNAALFLCQVTEPRRMGSGRTAYLDSTPLISTSILLGWEDDGKVFVKCDKDMSVAEFNRFNPFVRSDATIVVLDREQRVAYFPDCFSQKTNDPDWTYKTVLVKDLLAYITKEITLEELDARATAQAEKRDQLEWMRSRLEDSECRLHAALSQYEYLSKKAGDWQNKAAKLICHTALLYDWLKFIPQILRPKRIADFTAAYELFLEK